jgi:hypothetical protein
MYFFYYCVIFSFQDLVFNDAAVVCGCVVVVLLWLVGACRAGCVGARAVVVVSGVFVALYAPPTGSPE